jgi:antitoxin ParD1/3/4
MGRLKEHAMAISVDLGRQLEDYVTELLSTGRYGSKSEVLREGVRLVQEREARLAVQDAAILQGLREAEAGDFEPAEVVFDRLRAKYTPRK